MIKVCKMGIRKEIESFVKTFQELKKEWKIIALLELEIELLKNHFRENHEVFKIIKIMKDRYEK